MLDRSTILKLFKALDAEMRARDAIGEVLIVGGAVMCLVFKSRKATKDVDAAFFPTGTIREAAAAIASDFDVPDDWLNDAAKAYLTPDVPTVEVLSLPNLRVLSPTAEYMLAMKAVSARFDTSDRADLVFLIKFLGLKKPSQVFDIVSAYYPDRLVPPKTQFLVQEIMAGGGKRRLR